MNEDYHIVLVCVLYNIYIYGVADDKSFCSADGASRFFIGDFGIVVCMYCMVENFVFVRQYLRWILFSSA